nr:Gag-Pol polyprotein [Tanacetum cinerariifolium]
LKFLNNLQPEWSRYVTIVHHPLALMANSNNLYVSPAPHQDLSPFNQNFSQQPMTHPEDITDPTTAMNTALALMAKAFKLNYSTPTNNNQRISSNPRNRQIAQPSMNMGQDRQMQMIGDSERKPTTSTERVFETYKNVTQEIRDQLNAEAEAVQIILTGIDNDIYSTVDACPNACEMWKAIERLKQGESINVQDLKTNLFWEFGKFTSQDGESLKSYYSRFYKMMNELVRNKCKVTNHQVNVRFLLQLQPE